MLLTEFKLDDPVKVEVVAKLQKYFEDELQQKIGSFDAEFYWTFSLKKWVATITIRGWLMLSKALRARWKTWARRSTY